MIQYDYRGKVAFITGGSSGLGLASARAFAEAGAHVVLAARGERAGRDACTALERAGAVALFVAPDVREEASVARAVEQAVRRFGRIDFACNAAGVGGDLAPLERSNQAVWDDVLATNARGVWLAMRHEIPALLASGGGAIVNLSSIYGAAVGALVAEHPMGRMAREEEIAGAVLWLCSEAAGYITGAPIAVDGGFLAA